MTDTNHLPTQSHLGLILHRILVDIRNWGLLHDRHPEAVEELTGLSPKLVAKLADVAEIIPLQFIHSDDEYLATIESSLRTLASEHPFARRYSAVLDMTPDEVFHGLMPNATAAIH